MHELWQPHTQLSSGSQRPEHHTHRQRRLVKLTLTDERGDKADQLDITLDDSDGLLDIRRISQY
ncbi:hypothetical protein [Nitrincola iocasae]|uniref:Uncharacterized protein n=1 Tax=Nitrincola iocasae TaxID=2614693 RepID=A0A5J6LCZ3_9GAMM|nr:hypothetical protein [Nitrincola iocasae]QEW06343.1 hypothetical protein F5I99_07400 [Nitrincola iocasae]